MMSGEKGTPELIFGTGLLGMKGFIDADSFGPALEAILESQETTIASTAPTATLRAIDTAARYPAPKNGEAERILGRSFKSNTAGLDMALDTKVLTGGGDGSGDLTAAAIAASIEASRARLGITKFRTLYAHRFDPTTPLAETAAAFNHHLKLGDFERWGVCRYPPDQLTELLDICEREGYAKPAVYQCEYNVVTRGAERLVLPILRAHGMHLVAHRPLAAGFLTGNFTDGKAEGTRFAEGFGLAGVHTNLYDEDGLHNAVRQLQAKLAAHGISPAEASLRWAAYHSVLGGGDGIVFGCSSVKQIKDNAAAAAKGPLPDDVGEWMSSLWAALEHTERAEVL